MTKIIVAAFAAIALLGGCSAAVQPAPAPTVTVTKSADPVPAPEPPPSTETEYVAALRSMNNPVIDAATDSELIQMGNAVCDALNSGATTDDVIAYMAEEMAANGQTSRYELQAAGYIIGAADIILCPATSRA